MSYTFDECRKGQQLKCAVEIDKDEIPPSSGISGEKLLNWAR